MARIFISHSSKDNHAAIAFRQWLIDEGYEEADVFLDLFGIGVGERWRDALNQANERCEAVVFLASPESLASAECRLEIRMAEDLGKDVLVAILRDLAPDDGRLAPHADRQIVDLSVSPRDHRATIEHGGASMDVAFHRPGLSRIKQRLESLGIGAENFAWRPSAPAASASPYPGLAGFQEGDAGIFFGRGGSIARCFSEVRRLRRRGAGAMLAIQAGSGAGKSSFLKAGIWPRLQRDNGFAPLMIIRPARGAIAGEMGIARGFSDWLAERGGDASRVSVVASLEDGGAGAFVDLLNESIELAHRELRIGDPLALLPTPVIGIDQAEELTSGEYTDQSLRFLELASSLIDPGSDWSRRLAAPPIFLATVRADSVHELISMAQEAGIPQVDAFLLPQIAREAYRDIILGPATVAKSVGLNIQVDEPLVETLVEESVGADALPLMAFTLKQLIDDHRIGRRAVLSLPHYEAMGGIGGSLARRLETVRDGAPLEEFEAALRALLIPFLATWDPASSPPGARRVVAVEASLFEGERAGLRPLAEKLVEARLLTRGSGVLEVAHEALLRQPPMSNWLAEDADFLVWRDRTEKERFGYVNDMRGLLVGRELDIARGFLEERPSEIAREIIEFIGNSEQADQERRAYEADRERARREAAEAAAAAAQRAASRTRIGLVVAICLLVVATFLGVRARNEAARADQQTVIAKEEAQRAEYEAETAKLRGDASRALAERFSGPVNAMKLAIEAKARHAVSFAPAQPPHLPILDAALFATAEAGREIPRLKGFRDGRIANVVAMRAMKEALLVASHQEAIIVDQHGRMLAPPLAGKDGEPGYINAATWLTLNDEPHVALASGVLQDQRFGVGVSLFTSGGELVVRYLETNEYPFTSIAHLPDENVLLAGDAGGALFLIEIATGEVRNVLPGSRGRALTGIATVASRDQSPPVVILAYGQTPQGVLNSAIPANQGGEVTTPTPTPLSPKERSDLSATLGGVEIFILGLDESATDGRRCLFPDAAHGEALVSVITCDDAGGATLWTRPGLATPKPLWPAARYEIGGLPAVAVAHDAEKGLVAIGSGDGQIRIYASTGEALAPALQHTDDQLTALAFSSHGSVLLSAGGGAIRRWDVGDLPGERHQFRGPSQDGGRMTLSADGALALMTAPPEAFRVDNFQGLDPQEATNRLLASMTPEKLLNFGPTASRFDEIFLIDLNAPESAVIDSWKAPRVSHGGASSSAISQSGLSFAWSTETDIYWASRDTFAFPRSLPIPKGEWVTAMSFDPSGTRLIVALTSAPHAEVRMMAFPGWMPSEKETSRLMAIDRDVEGGLVAAEIPDESFDAITELAVFETSDRGGGFGVVTGDRTGGVSFSDAGLRLLARSEPERDGSGAALAVHELIASPSGELILAIYASPTFRLPQGINAPGAKHRIALWSTDSMARTGVEVDVDGGFGAAAIDFEDRYFAASTAKTELMSAMAEAGGRTDEVVHVYDTITGRLTKSKTVTGLEKTFRYPMPQLRGLSFRPDGELDGHLMRWGRAAWPLSDASILRAAKARAEAWTTENKSETLITNARTREAEGDFDASIADLSEALELDPMQPSVRLQLARQKYRVGDRVGALQDLKQALEIDPYNFTTHYDLGRLHYWSGDFVEAEKSFRTASASFDSDVRVNLVVATFLPTSLTERLQTLQQMRQRRRDAANWLAYTLKKQGTHRWREAEELLSGIVRDRGGDPKDHRSLFEMRLELGRTQEALEAADAAFAKLQEGAPFSKFSGFSREYDTAGKRSEQICAIAAFANQASQGAQAEKWANRVSRCD